MFNGEHDKLDVDIFEDILYYGWYIPLANTILVLRVRSTHQNCIQFASDQEAYQKDIKRSFGEPQNFLVSL